MAFNIIATVTDLGRQRMAEMLTEGKSFSVNQFEVGEGGHDPLDPTIARTPDPSLTSCPDSVFGPEPIDTSFLSSQFCPEFVCRLEADEAVAPLSNICLIGEIVYSPEEDDPDVGSTFLFAIGNYPLRVKTDSEDLEYRVTVQF